MKVVNIKKIKADKKGPPLFNGVVEFQSPVSDGEGADINIGYVHFPKGVKNKFHKHSKDQVLIATSGRGFIETKHEHHDLRKGDVVWSPAGEIHSHGAQKNESFTHITITPKKTKLTQVED